MLYNFAADSFYIMKLCSRLFVLHCRSRPKYDNSRHFDPHFEEVRGGVEPWLMARWKARAEFLLSVIELLFLSRCLQEWVGHLEPKFQGKGVVPREYFLVSTKLDTFLQRTQCSHCKRCISYGNSVRPSVRPSVTRRYCVKTTARSTVQFAPLDSKACLVL